MSVVINVVGQFDGKQLDRAQRELDKLGKTVKEQESKVSSMGKGFKAAGGLVAAAVGTQMVGSVIEFGRRMNDLAIEADTTERKFSTVFGDMTETMRQWADEQNESFGVSEVRMRGFLAAVQDILIPLGFARDAAADMTQEVVLLANALTEFTPGTTAEQAIGALTAALTGEREQLKQFGIVLKDSDIKARLAEKGLSGLTGEALKQETAIASLELAYELGGDALAAYTDRAGTAIAEQKLLTAELEDAEQTIAEVLKPELDYLREIGVNIATSFGDAATGIRDFREEAEKEPKGLLETLFENRGIKATTQQIYEWFGGVGELGDTVGETAAKQAALNAEAEAGRAAARDLAEELQGAKETTQDFGESMVTAGKHSKRFYEQLEKSVIEAAKTHADKIEEITDSIGFVPDALSGAVEEMDISWDEMRQNLEDQADQHETFTTNLATLYALGFDDIADQFMESGPQVAGALEDFMLLPMEQMAAEEAWLEVLLANTSSAPGKVAAGMSANASKYRSLFMSIGTEWMKWIADGMDGFVWDINPTVHPRGNNNGVRVTTDASGWGLPVAHTGGVVPGRAGTEVPMLLMAGETVLPTHNRNVDGPMGETSIHIYNPQTNDLNSDLQRALTAVRLLEVV